MCTMNVIDGLTWLFTHTHLVSDWNNHFSGTQGLQSQVVISSIVQPVALHSWNQHTRATLEN